MNFLRTIVVAAISIAFMPVSAQDADFYSVPMPNNNGSFYLMYKPDTGFADMLKYDRDINTNAIKPVIENYGEKTVLFETDSFSIITDRTSALYLRSKNGTRDVFLKKYFNEELCWDKGALLYAKPTGKNSVGIFLANSKGETFTKNGTQVKCGSEILPVNIEVEYANSTGTQPKSELQKVAAGISVVQENKVLLIRVPREAVSKYVSFNFKLYNSAKKEVKDFLNIKAAESVLYINDLPKGKYKYIVEIYDGTLVTEGTVTIVKK